MTIYKLTESARNLETQKISVKMFVVVLITLAALQGSSGSGAFKSDHVPWEECQNLASTEFCLAAETLGTTSSVESSCLANQTCDTFIFATHSDRSVYNSWYIITPLSLPKNVDNKQITLSISKSKLTFQNYPSDSRRLQQNIETITVNKNTTNSNDSSSLFAFVRSEQFEVSDVLWQAFKFESNSNMTNSTISGDVYPSLLVQHHFVNGSSHSHQTSVSKPIRLFSSTQNSTRLAELFRQGGHEDKANSIRITAIVIFSIFGVCFLGVCCCFMYKIITGGMSTGPRARGMGMAGGVGSRSLGRHGRHGPIGHRPFSDSLF